jgi:hypothetical protein
MGRVGKTSGCVVPDLEGREKRKRNSYGEWHLHGVLVEIFSPKINEAVHVAIDMQGS